MITQSPKRRLPAVTWVLGDKPSTAKRKAAGCWTHGKDTALPVNGRKVGNHIR